MTPRNSAIGLVLLAILSMQIAAAMSVTVFSQLGPLGTTWVRSIVGAVLVLLFIRPLWTPTVRANLGKIALLGATIGCMNIFFYLALQRIPLGATVTIQFAGPLGLAALRSRRPLDFLWIALAATGVVLLSPISGSALDPIGVGFAMLAAVGWAGYVLASGYLGSQIPGLSGIALSLFVVAIVQAPTGVQAVPLLIANPQLISMVIAIGVVGTLPFLCEFHALRTLSPRTYGVLISLEPAVAAMLGAAMLDQMLTVQMMVAIVCVSIAALGVAVEQ